MILRVSGFKYVVKRRDKDGDFCFDYMGVGCCLIVWKVRFIVLVY